MKSFSIFLTVTFLAASISQAGWKWNKEAYDSAKSPMVEERITSQSYCYDAGYVFSIFGSGFFSNEPLQVDDAFGGGVSLGYFFGHNLGVDFSYSLHANAESAQVGTANIVYRFPLGGECCSTIAPYVFGGPGVVSSGDSEFLMNIGAGLDWRFESWGCIAMFADASYNFVNDPAVPDFTQVRVGARFPF